MTNITPVRWNTNCYPEIDVIVYVWHPCGTLRAVWNGKNWKTPDGLYLTEITHWRPLKD